MMQNKILDSSAQSNNHLLYSPDFSLISDLFINIGHLFKNLSTSGIHQINAVTKNVEHTNIESQILKLADPIIQKMFTEQYCSNFKLFDGIFNKELVEQSEIFTYAIYNIRKCSNVDEKNSNLNHNKIEKDCSEEKNSKDIKKAEYLWNSCSISEKAKIKNLLIHQVMKSDKENIDRIHLNLNDLIANLPLSLNQVLLDLIHKKYNLYKTMQKSLKAQLNEIINKQKKYDKVSKELITDQMFDLIKDENIKHLDKLMDLIIEKKLEIENKIVENDILISYFKKYFEIEDQNICNICNQNSISCAINCGHVFCKECINSIKTNCVTFEPACPYCNQSITNVLNIFI